MKCPFCKNNDTKVVDSRPVEDGLAIRRRRQCPVCNRRFTTFEKMEETLLVVVKSDGRKESFDKNKLIKGLLKSCEKTKITYEDVQHIAEDIEHELNNRMEKEVSSKVIGSMIMERLRVMDEVAYVRFASVYHKFTDAETFRKEIDKLFGAEAAKGSSGKRTKKKA